MLRNIILASVIATVLIAGASQAQAQSVGDIQSQIQSLVQRIAELTKQLSALRGNASAGVSHGATVTLPAPAPAHRICAMSVRAFNQGSEGDDVRAFQEFLQSEGHLRVSPTGFYGPLTREALAKWQAAQGFESAGVVGPKTLERIRIKCGLGQGNESGRLSASPSSGNAPLTVTFSHYVGGFRPAGISYTLDFGDGGSERATECPAPADACTGPGTNTHTYRSNGTYTATLNKITDPCPDDNDPSTPRCLAAIHSEVIGKVQINVGTGSGACTKEYKPVCGAKTIYCITTPCNPVPTTYGNRCMMNTDGASFLYEGQCSSATTNPADNPQCKSWYDGCNTCSRSTPGGVAMCTLRACMSDTMSKPYCTGYFDTTSNRAPSVSGLSGPTTLAVGASGSWTVVAADPENGNLTYSVNWGESTSGMNLAAQGASAEFRQTTSFSHTYATAGTYTITVTVTDNAGQSAKAVTTVKVGDSPVACTMQYDPVCGRPSGCANTCAPGQACPAICQLHQPQTYGNRCQSNAAGAQFLHTGQCTSSSGNIY